MRRDTPSRSRTVGRRAVLVASVSTREADGPKYEAAHVRVKPPVTMCCCRRDDVELTRVREQLIPGAERSVRDAAHDVQRIRVTSLPFVTRMADPSRPNVLAAKFTSWRRSSVRSRSPR
jgi:hypothetical protein